jgi:predicted nucleotidyltransferase
MNKVRLTDLEISTIKNLAKTHLDSEDVYIFGSRADLNKRGGDIDIYIETKQKDGIFQKKIKFLTEFELTLGMQKVDLIINNFTKDKDIFKIAKSTGVKI